MPQVVPPLLDEVEHVWTGVAGANDDLAFFDIVTLGGLDERPRTADGDHADKFVSILVELGAPLLDRLVAHKTLGKAKGVFGIGNGNPGSTSIDKRQNGSEQGHPGL